MLQGGEVAPEDRSLRRTASKTGKGCWVAKILFCFLVSCLHDFIQVEEKKGKTEGEEKNIVKHCGTLIHTRLHLLNSTYCVAWHCGHMDE